MCNATQRSAHAASDTASQLSGFTLTLGRLVRMGAYATLAPSSGGLCRRGSHAASPRAMPAGLANGARARGYVPMAEVRKHATVEDGWSVINGVVYNVTPYLRFHPGGAKIMKLALGKDATALFTKYHAWVNVQALLSRCVVGLLEKKGGGGAAMAAIGEAPDATSTTSTTTSSGTTAQ
jgi:cytochrome b involved in lipid metabolism